jgi:predicted MFS family arabinose efflux permease
MQTVMAGKRHLILFASAVFLFWFAHYVFMPTLPEYLRGKVQSLTALGGVLAMYGLWQALVRLPLGVLIDAVGRQKLFVLGGFLLFVLGAMVLGTGGTTFALYAGRSLTGLSMGIWVPLVVVFSSFFPAEQSVRASAILTLVTAAARITATSLNGYLNEWAGYIAAFLVAAAAAALGAVLVLPVQLGVRAGRTPKLRPLLRVFARRNVLLPSLLAAVNQYVIFGISLGFIPVLAKRLGAQDVVLGYLATVNLLFFLMGNLIVTSSSSRFRPESMVLVSYLLFSAAVAAATLAKSIPPLFLIQGSIGTAHGIGYPVLMGLSIRDVSLEQRTSALGMHQSVYAAGVFIGPWVSGALADAIGIRPMFGLTAALVLAVGLTGGIVLSRRAALTEAKRGKPPARDTSL